MAISDRMAEGVKDGKEKEPTWKAWKAERKKCKGRKEGRA